MNKLTSRQAFDHEQAHGKDIVADEVTTSTGMRRSIHCDGNAIKGAANPDQVITSFAQKLAGRQRRHDAVVFSRNLQVRPKFTRDTATPQRGTGGRTGKPNLAAAKNLSVLPAQR